MSVLAALAFVILNPPLASPVRLPDVLDRIISLGYHIESTGDRREGTLRKGTTQLVYELSDVEVNAGLTRRALFLEISCRFLLDHPEPTLQKWFASLGLNDWICSSLITDVVDFKLRLCELDSLSILDDRLDEGSQVYANFAQRFKGICANGVRGAGHMPPNNLPLRALGLEELSFLVDHSGWNHKPKSMNVISIDPAKLRGGTSLGYEALAATIDHVDISLTCQREPDESIWVFADIPVEKGVDTKSLVQRLQPDSFIDFRGPTQDMPRIEGLWPGDGCYSYGLAWLLHGETVGELRREIESFAHRVRTLPHC